MSLRSPVRCPWLFVGVLAATAVVAGACTSSRSASTTATTVTPHVTVVVDPAAVPSGLRIVANGSVRGQGAGWRSPDGKESGSAPIWRLLDYEDAKDPQRGVRIIVTPVDAFPSSLVASFDRAPGWNHIVVQGQTVDVRSEEGKSTVAMFRRSDMLVDVTAGPDLPASEVVRMIGGLEITSG